MVWLRYTAQLIAAVYRCVKPISSLWPDPKGAERGSGCRTVSACPVADGCRGVAVLAGAGRGGQGLLGKAQDIGNRLSKAFNTPRCSAGPSSATRPGLLRDHAGAQSVSAFRDSLGDRVQVRHA